MSDASAIGSGADAVLAAFNGPGGVRVEVRDETRPYGYSNIFTVKLRVEATFPGADERFVRHLEKMGVFTDGLEAARDELIASFRETGLPYLFREGFVEQLARRQAAQPVRAAGYLGKR